jgi:LPXTG-motif cell wall-anchored protein
VLPVTTTSAPATLPTTGGNITFFAELGSLLVLVGLCAIFGTRRRRTTTPHVIDLRDGR